ncbi:MAG: radical SAM protein [Armatimonadota bacterium]
MSQSSLFPDAFAERSSFPSQRVSAREASFVPLAELAPPAAGAAAKGIARLAADAPELDHRNEVEYRDLPCRSILNRVQSSRVPFELGINPYRGCEFGCVYCYARYTHEFMELEQWLDFERRVFVKRGAPEALRSDLARMDLDGKWIAIGTATDPYQPAERRYGVTRSLLELFARRRGMRLSITTKSDLVTRDLDLLQRIAAANEIEVNVTVTTPHHALSRRIEPRAPRPDRRLGAVKTLSSAGIRAGVFVMPVMPRINDRLEDLDLLMRQARVAGASYLAAQVLFLRSCSRKRFFPFIEEEFPELLPHYRRLYGSHRTPALAEYTRGMTQSLQALKRKHGLAGGGRWWDKPWLSPDQLTLL